ncbi:MAG TPA: transporter substrate-binding domain-containing protein [Thermotogota bacterium]|nr:transporter substrate-binding domain-containing protein [Thermotogota bacterium]
MINAVSKKTVILFFLCLSLSACCFAEGLTFLINHDYRPFSFVENERLQGFAVELISALSPSAEETAQMHGMAFDQAYSLLLSGGDYALPTLVFTSERKPLFQWVGPIAIAMTHLYASPFFFQKIASLEEAKTIESIGVVKAFYSTQLLEREGFKNLVYFEDEKQLLENLLSGAITLAPFDDSVLFHLLEGRSASSTGLRSSVPLNLDMMYIGFSRNVPEETVSDWQARLDRLKKTGEFRILYQKWLPENPVPGQLTLLTEEYPPVTYAGEDGKPTGFVTRIVEEALRRNGLEEEPILVPWSIGYELASHLPGILLFSMDQTPQRAGLFEWIGPVGRNTAYLYARSDSDVSIENLGSAKSVSSIATTKNWWTEQLLQEKGFTNLRSSLHPSENVRQLINGEVTLAIFTDLTVQSLVEETGYTMDRIRPLFEVQSNYFYIAASKGTDPTIVYNLQKTLDTMKQDGSFEAILRRDVPNVLVTPLLFQSSTPEVREIKIGSHQVENGYIVQISLPLQEEADGVWDVKLSNPGVLVDLGKENDFWFFKTLQNGPCAVVFSLYRSGSRVPIKIYTIEVIVE